MTTLISSSAAPQFSIFLGVDVASGHLDICAYGSNTVKRIDNTTSAISCWLRSLPVGCAIAMESTGIYHRLLVTAAHAAGFAVYLLNPRDVRMYARGLGARGKTDRLDAQVLARYVAHEHSQLRLWQPQPTAQLALDELLRRRAAVVKCQQLLRMSAAGCAPAQANMTSLMQEFANVIKRYDQQIADAVKVVAADTQDFAHITSVPGIGLLSGAALLGVFRRLAAGNADAVIAFLGLDPRPMNSGHKVGRRRLSKRGPAEWRRLLFNAAMSGSLTQSWKGCYERERAKGLPRIAALNVLARKMVRVAFSLFKNQRLFEASLITVKAENA
jgi:transposase